MADDGRNPVISVKVAGRMRRLATSKQWRSAIANGELTRETLVSVERGPGRLDEMQAGKIGELSGLFDELIGPSPAPPPPAAPQPPPRQDPPSAPRPAAPRPWGAAEAAPPPRPPSIAVEEALVETIEEPVDPPAPPPPVTAGGSKTPLLFAGSLVLLLIVGLVLSNRSEEAATSVAGEEALLPVENQYSQRFWAPRDLPIRTSRSKTARESGQLSRGEQILATPPVDGWVELANGGFVWFDDLLIAAPPHIDRSTVDDYFTIEPGEVLDAPSSDGSSIAVIDQLKRVRVLGTVNSDYAEIITDTGKVGYVNWQAFGGVGGKGRSAWVAVSNRCNTTKNIAFSFTVNGARTAHVGYWTFGPGFNGGVEYGNSPGTRIYVDSVFNFFADLGDDFHLRGGATVAQEGDDKVRVNGRLVEMKRVVPELTEDGAYQINFC